MLSNSKMRVNLDLGTALKPAAYYLQQPVRLFRTYNSEDLRSDLSAGVTVAIILLPQAIAFALIAELPGQMGLYTAVVGAIVGALWGASNQMHTGPANAISLLVFSTLSGMAEPGSPDFLVAAGLLAVMAGLFQLALGLARLGALVNFVSHSVIVGFASGAGILIAVKQFSPLLGLQISGHNPLETIWGIVTNIPSIHDQSAVLGIGTMLFIMLLRKLNPKLPAAFVSMILASIVVYILQWDKAGVAVIGELPRNLPPLADLPLFDLDRIAQLSIGALAVGAIGLVETVAIARSVATQTGQRLDSNQEFIGQGLANIAVGFFSGFPAAGSFSRTAVNFNAGAKTPVAAIFSSAFVLVAMLTLGRFAAYLPRAALAGVLIITAYRMIDRDEIRRIVRGTRGDALIMVVTLFGTLFLEIEFAVFTGILLSFARYIMRTSTPRVQPVVPAQDFTHFRPRPEVDECPQLGILDILGDLYFGAVQTVEEAIFAHAAQHPEQRYLILRMVHVNHCDFSGIYMLENLVRTFRSQGGDVFLVRVNDTVRGLMRSTRFDAYLGFDHFLSEDDTIAPLFYRVLDPAVCIYECPLRVFKECQNLPKRIDFDDIPQYDEIPIGSVRKISAQRLWEHVHQDYDRTLIIDVRQPREFKRGHIIQAELIPMPELLEEQADLPNNRPIVLVCRSGRRSQRAAYALQKMGAKDVAILDGGMLAWETAGFTEAFEL